MRRACHDTLPPAIFHALCNVSAQISAGDLRVELSVTLLSCAELDPFSTKRSLVLVSIIDLIITSGSLHALNHFKATTQTRSTVFGHV